MKPYTLVTHNDQLSLALNDEPDFKPLSVDFTDKTLLYRIDQGGGRKESIAKAVGIKQGLPLPQIVDATAGLGRDAFVLAALGCRVHMIERSEIIGSLLEDGLKRAEDNPDIGAWVKERMSLVITDFHTALKALPFKPDVIYLDPMYPLKKKSAHVKKESRVLQEVVGDDPDSDKLLHAALQSARERVVVKRPVWADPLNSQKPHTVIESKKNRFDLYII